MGTDAPGSSSPVLRYLAQIGAASRSGEDLVMLLTRRTAGDSIDADGIRLEPGLLESVPESLSFDNRILPIHRTEDILFVAVPAGKAPDEGIRELGHLAGVHVEPIPVTEIDVLGVLVKAHQLMRRRRRTSPILPGAAPVSSSAGAPGLSDLGVPEEIQGKLLGMLSEAQGLILITGPSRSGKSTTLKAIAGELRERQRRVAWIEEDQGIARLEERLADDPDLVLLDGLRSPSVASRAVRAAVEGRRILIAVEASDTAGALARLEELKADPHLAGVALRVGLNQRLVRRLCTGCREEWGAAPERLEDLRLEGLLHGLPLYRGRGCGACGGTGFQGVAGIFEYADRDPAGPLRSRLRPLIADALGKMLSGITTLDELVEQVPFVQILQAADRLDVRKLSP